MKISQGGSISIHGASATSHFLLHVTQGLAPIIGELRASLDANACVQIAANLDALYDYMCRRLLKANSESSIAILDEVSSLLHELRGAWLAIPAEARQR